MVKDQPTLAELPDLLAQLMDPVAETLDFNTGSVLQGHIDYWKRQLSGELPTLALVADHARRQPPVGRNSRFWVPPAQAAALRRFCDAEDVTLFMLLVAGHAAVLARTTRQNDLVIGSPISDRHHVETEGLIGFLLNTLPLRVRVDASASFRTLLQQVKQTCLDGYSWQAVPYEALMQDLQAERTSSGNPLFQTVLALLNTPDATPGSSALWGTGTEPPYPEFADEPNAGWR